MMDRVRVAIIGTGWWATATHIPALREMPEVELVALCDVSAERLEAAGDAYDVNRRYTDHRAMLAEERPDAVVVATTHATHFGVACNCLEAGAHVLVEKPLTLHALDARALVQKAEERGRALILGYPWNYSSHAIQARELIASGRLGAIQLVQSVMNAYNADLLAGRDRSDRPGGYPVHGPGDVYSRKEHSGGGHGHLQITHAAGLLFFVTGLRANVVQARMANRGLPLDLLDVILVEFEGGALGSVSGTSNSFLPKSSLTIGCEAGSVELDVYAGATTVRSGDGEKEEFPPLERSDLRTAPTQDLIDIARGAKKPLYAAEAGWRSVELLDAAYRSAESDGRPVSILDLYQGGS